MSVMNLEIIKMLHGITMPDDSMVSSFLAVPPDTVRVIATPAVAAEGDRVNISCVTASSNPASAITWWRDGVPFGGESSMP